eukprot:jgi/Psemu1/28670/gm1.28670_g
MSSGIVVVVYLIVEMKALLLKTNMGGNKQQLDIVKKLQRAWGKRPSRSRRRRKRRRNMSSSRFRVAVTAKSGEKWVPSLRHTRGLSSMGGGGGGWESRLSSSQQKVDVEDENVFPDQTWPMSCTHSSFIIGLPLFENYGLMKRASPDYKGRADNSTAYGTHYADGFFYHSTVSGVVLPLELLAISTAITIAIIWPPPEFRFAIALWIVFTVIKKYSNASPSEEEDNVDVDGGGLCR